MKKKLLTLLIAISMIMAMSMLSACGGSGGDSGDSGGGSEASEAAEPADPAEKFPGVWKLAAAESQGVYMAGDFTSLLDLAEEGDSSASFDLTINDDKTGTVNFGDDSANFTWELKSDDVITITLEKETDEVGETADISYKEDALWLTIEQEDDKSASLIYTRDGVFPDAKVFSMSDAAAITSKDELIGKWTLSGAKMMGLVMYGDGDAIKEAMGGEDTYIDFKDDGTTEMNGASGTWEITDDGASMTSTDVTGTHTYPIKKLGDDIVLDCTEIMGGAEFLMVLSK